MQRKASGGKVVEDDPIDVRFERQRNRLRLAGIETGCKHASVEGLAHSTCLDPVWHPRQVGRDLTRDRCRDQDLSEEAPEQREPADLSQGDEDAGIGYDFGHASRAAFSVSQSSLVIWK